MVGMIAYLNEDDTEVSLEFPDKDLTLTARQIEELTELLIDLRLKMQPPMSETSDTLN